VKNPLLVFEAETHTSTLIGRCGPVTQSAFHQSAGSSFSSNQLKDHSAGAVFLQLREADGIPHHFYEGPDEVAYSATRQTRQRIPRAKFEIHRAFQRSRCKFPQ
jgi:hypothetical protein